MYSLRVILSKTVAISRINTSNFNRIVRSISSQRPASRFSIRSFRASQQIPGFDSQSVVLHRSPCRTFATENLGTFDLSERDFESYCAETLESLSDYFDELVEKNEILEAADVVYKDGILTVFLGEEHGTYVINKQTPNKQIWLSSPFSGPKRFDYVPSSKAPENGSWIYKHTGVGLHELLEAELKQFFAIRTLFQVLPFGGLH